MKAIISIAVNIVIFSYFASQCLVKSEERAPKYFRFGQFYPTKGVSSAEKSETLAAGPIRDIIRRNTPRFRKVLIRNVNPNIKFRKDDARYMTSRTKSKLDVLAIKVKNTWGNGVQLYVFRGWTDPVREEDRLSLRNEGRSLHVLVSDQQNSKLTRLAGLALESGFDWVYYGVSIYITVSVIPDVCQTKVDLAFLIDTSGSVSFPNYEKIKKFLNQVVDYFNVGKDETRIGLISYSNRVVKEFALNRYFDKNSMKHGIEKMKYIGSLTATGEALRTMKDWAFSTSNGARDDKAIPKIGILLTDGRSNSGYNVFAAAEEVHKRLISMFVIGVGQNLGFKEINAVATDPDHSHVFRLENFHDLNGFVEQLSTVSCDEGAAVSTCDSAVTSVEGGSFKYFTGKFGQNTKYVTIEVVDQTGKNFLYVSTKNKNPGPLDATSTKATGSVSPRAVTKDLKKEGTQIVYIAVQGQEDKNRFLITIWDSLFEKDNYDVAIYENDNKKTPIIQAKSSQAGYTFRYSISYGNERNSFTIDQNTGEISATKPLDREVEAQYQLVIVAQDVNLKCHKGRAVVKVTVKDRNDNKPKFSLSKYTVRIREDRKVGDEILKVSATDMDTGENAKVQYFIEQSTYSSMLSINDKTGQIYLKKPLDYETLASFQVNLGAQDGGNPPQSGFSVLTVLVEDSNEPPYFTGSCANSANPCSAAIAENLAAGTAVKKLSAKDPDIRQSCRLAFSLTSSDAYYFKIDKFSGQISTSRPLDRELKENYVLKVQVTDCSSLSQSTTVLVKATDMNDNAPVFSDKEYFATIIENKPGGTNVINVAAKDLDAGLNAKITYSMSGGGASAFSIDKYSGLVSSLKALDREIVSSYILTITASDLGKPAKVSNVKLSVRVSDVNDNSPVFQGNTGFKIVENARRGTIVGTVKVKDKDEGLNAKVRCSISTGNIGYAFVMDADKCTLYSQGALDRETRAIYTLGIKAVDLGRPSLSKTENLQVSITDVNDNAPVFKQSLYRLNIKENTKPSSTIGKVSASDLDIGQNAVVVYFIASGDDKSQKFKVDENSGHLTLISPLDFGTRNSYELTLKAEDKGVPKKMGTSIVRITVVDTNDFTPVFSTSSYQSKIAEDSAVGTMVVQVTATDKDSGPSGKLLFSITAGNTESTFQIDSVSGVIKTVKNVDYELVKSYKLTVKVTDMGHPARAATAMVNVQVTDVNDNAPELTPNPTIFKVSEAKSVGYMVGILNATDADSGVNSKLTFSSLSLSVPFKVESSGKILISKELDYESIKEYTIDVTVRDQGVPQLKDTGKVVIKVQDANDNAPVFSTPKCEVIENSKTGTHVCYTKANDADSGANGNVEYTLTGNGTFPFKIDKVSGQVTTTGDLDRETTQEYSAKVTAIDKGTPALSKELFFKILIEDENDNVPVFEKASYTFSVPEESSKSIEVGTVKADDKDIGKNGKLVYSIVSGNEGTSFTIDAVTGIISSKPMLDRETRDKYNLVVRVQDQGRPSLSAEVNVRISILDINDNSPVFRGDPYKSQIREDAGVGNKVIQVISSDADIGKNAEVIYSITGGKNKDAFQIDGITGIITNRVGLDYETIKNYDLTVTASDKGVPSRSATCQVNISVINVDDNAPEFGKIVEVQVSESVNVGFSVVKFNAKDKDGGVLIYSISGGNSEGSFEVAKLDGELQVKKRLDRERTDFYNISVTVTDASAHTTVGHLPIKILDVNDNNPVFVNTSYTAKVRENQQSGKFVMKVSATDKDIGTNKELEYSIESGNVNDAFILNTKTGHLMTKRSLDREAVAMYSLTVKAVDKGTPALSSVVTVNVAVEDENDNTPDFEKKSYDTSLAENNNVGATIIIVKANDPDEGPNGKITYSLKSEDGGAVSSFSVDPIKGVVTTTKVLDRESHEFYKLVVAATDGGTPPREAAVDISVSVIDENDNAPVIISPNKIDPILENITVKTKIADIKAKDADSGQNGKFTYKIVSGNIKNAFSLNWDSGVLSTATTLDREDISSYLLRINVVDQGTPPLETSKDYLINLTDVNDNCPKFTRQVFKVTVKEDLKTNMSVMKLKANDADIGANAKLTFSIKKSANSDYFTCDRQTGGISTAKSLDYETVKSYNMECEVSDGICADKVPCKVEVENINDNFPIFEKSAYSVNIKEDAAIGKAILTIKATDKDSFGRLLFEIVPNSNEFSIGAYSGEIKTLVKFDRETKSEYSFTVKATDGGQPTKSSTVNVTVIIDDVNDNPPVFKKDSDTVVVQENRKLGALVITLEATDIDAGVNKEIFYEIVGSPSSNNFTIDRQSGEIRTTAEFDREQVASYVVEFIAKDKGKPQKTSKPFALTVNVGDENDNKPLFTKKNNISVSEGAVNGTVVAGIFAQDQDIGKNAEVIYSIIGNNVPFSIDSSSGVITVKEKLDREMVDYYSLKIIATDRGTPPQTNSRILGIQVLDINDNRPVYDLGTLTGRVNENMKKGTIVTTVHATDRDKGANGMVSYSLKDNDKFTIDPKSGIVTTLKPLDREEQEIYRIDIVAKDHGIPTLFTSSIITVYVNDEDDNCPVFSPDVYNVTVEENIKIGTVLLTVKATDRDIGTNAELNYGVKDGDDGGAFYVNSKSGELSVRSVVDREKSDLFHLVVRGTVRPCGNQANDTDIPEGQKKEGNITYAHVYIKVNDVNDNPPHFGATSYIYRFTNSTVTNILNITATDDDTGKGGEVKFRKKDERVFKSNNEEGRLVVVEAYDQGTPSLLANTTVKIINKNFCGAMSFSVSERGEMSVATLCNFVTQPKPKDVELGDKIELECRAQGNTAAKYRWVRDGNIVSSPSSSGKLLIQNSTQDDEGQYSCVANSIAGNIISEEVKVQIYEKPRIVVEPSDVGVAVGADAVLTVKATGKPAPGYQWYRNGKLFLEGKGYKTDTLILTGAIVQDTGKYHCVVRNKFGQVETRKLTLNVFEDETVVKLTLKVQKPNTEKKCNYFNQAEFEKRLGTILGRKVSVTHVKKSAICNITACSPNPCKNKGRCEPTANGYICICNAEWTGKNCEKDQDECKAQSSVCQAGGTCTNSQGSYRCSCKQGRTGRNCELMANGCANKPCFSNQTCVLNSNNPPAAHSCVSKGQEFSVVLKAGKGIEKYMLQEFLNRLIKSMNQKTITQRRRRRATTYDFTVCDAHVVDSKPDSEGKVEVRFVLVCPEDLQNKVSSNSKTLCDGILTDETAESCSLEGKQTTTAAPKKTVPTSRIEVGVVVSEKGKPLSAQETAKLIEAKDTKDKLDGTDIELEDSSYGKGKREGNNSDNKTALAIGIVVGVLVLLAIVAAIFLFRRKKKGKQSHAFMISSRADDVKQSQQDLLRADHTMNAMDSPATFKKGSGYGNARDSCAPQPETFMFEMPAKISQKDKNTGVESLPYYRGVFSEAEAAKYFEYCKVPGGYMVYKTGDNRIILCVKAPNGGPPIRHIEATKSSSGEFVVKIGSMSPVSGETIEKIVEHFRVTPMSFGDTSPDVVLTEPWQKTAL